MVVMELIAYQRQIPGGGGGIGGGGPPPPPPPPPPSPPPPPPPPPFPVSIFLSTDYHRVEEDAGNITVFITTQGDNSKALNPLMLLIKSFHSHSIPINQGTGILLAIECSYKTLIQSAPAHTLFSSVPS